MWRYDTRQEDVFKPFGSGANSAHRLWTRDLFESGLSLAERELRDYLFQKLGGQTLLDFGSGSIGDTDSMHESSKKFGCSHYIGIDLFKGFSGGEPRSMSFDQRAFSVKGDMLLRVSQILSDTANVTINSIDNIIIPNQEYQEILTSEICRICRINGTIFGVNSQVLSIIRGRIRSGEINNFKEIENFIIKNIDEDGVFEKISE